ncbi:Probable RNA-directed DNA polymerase from transposon X-element [Eumeta japonica]|uniref:Probable RNA-directed DNA polymerase from transposon X-element n=1 Tax=Eumeta variegata TaxID=151549 RepID=A0A4C1XP39_EUMVA|nr:Probable RNA-directed DNA polymerase from transposon X-element [Eumeta japonica]
MDLEFYVVFVSSVPTQKYCSTLIYAVVSRRRRSEADRGRACDGYGESRDKSMKSRLVTRAFPHDRWLCLRRRDAPPSAPQQLGICSTASLLRPDNLTNETLKIGAPLLIPYLKLLFNEVVESEQVPDQWHLSQIILLYKKGNPLEVGNYRPISLLPSIYKLFSSILLSRIAPQIDKNQPIRQAGFRPNYSTNDHIHAVDQLIEKYKEFNKPLYIGIKLERKGEEFPIERSVKQGDPLSPKLFIAVLQDIFRNIDWADKGILVLNERLTHLRFADDIAMFSETATGFEQMFQNLASEKTKTEVDRRVNLAWRNYWAQKEILKGDYSLKMKKIIMDSCILPTLTYSSQTWIFTNTIKNKIRSCQHAMERSILKLRRIDKNRNTDIRNKTKLVDAYNIQ